VHSVQTSSRTLPTSYIMGTGGGAVSLGVKRTWREADHSTPSSVEFKNDGAPLAHTSSRRDV
jgi:hypothetical protein